MNYADILLGNHASACDQPLRIDDKNVGFLIAPLQQHCCFQQSSSRRAWRLSFFQGSAFERTITVFFKSTPNSLPDPKAWWIDSAAQPDHQAHEKDMSRFFRGTNTKKLDEAVYSNRQTRLLVDRENLVLLSNNRARFERIILCQALALAYKDALNTGMLELTQCIKSNDETQLIKLYEDMLRFNAADYFGHPVDQQRSHELYDIWEPLSRHWRLNERRQELTEQLADVANLIREQRSQREQVAHRQWQDALQKKDSAFNKKALFISVLVTTLSLLTLVQLTPDTFADFIASWISFFSD